MSTRTNHITGEEQPVRIRVTHRKGTKTKRQLTEDEERQADQEAEDARIAREARQAAETERMGKKLKKSELRALKQQNQDATSIAKLKAVNVEMIRLFENVVAYQQVEVEDD